MLDIASADCIHDDLPAIETIFRQELSSAVPCVRELVGHLSRYRGKMLRPALLLLSARAVGQVTHDHLVLAAVVEMVHMATLVHDDVLDEASLRRQGPTINYLHGNEAAVILGDYLISHSYHLCSSLRSQRAARIVARTTNRLCEGELLQISNRDNWDLDESTYMRIITGKTASLCAASCALGAIFAGADRAATARLRRYGLCVGRAFQIQDDILDIVGSQQEAGKTLGTDLAKGKLTLPVIHFLKNAAPPQRRAMRRLLAQKDASLAQRIRDMLAGSPSLAYARNAARRWARRAAGLIADLPGSEATRALRDMAHFAVQRCR